MPSNSKGRGGVLPVNAAQTKKSFKQQPRPPAPKLRLIIRRLPPGITEQEFWTAIGHEWQVGNGKTDWAAFKPGKISKEMGKPSRPARAYLKVKETSLLDILSTHVRSTVFNDAKNTSRDSCLLGPPTLEFAPYSKTPSGRTRHDGRQGTIDQDPEFIDFLQSLTEPITKPATNGDDADVKAEKATTTPLIQYIKEKKANKAKEKEAAAAKAATKKVPDTKEHKAGTSSKADQANTSKKGVAADNDKARVAKVTQQAVETVKKSVTEIKGQTQSASAKTDAASPAPANAKRPSTPTQSGSKRERQRGDASVAARIIGRDLGLAPREARSPRGQKSAVNQPTAHADTPGTAPATATGNTTPPAATSSNKTNVSQSSAAASNQSSPAAQPAQPPTGPKNLRNPPQPSPLRQTPVSQPKAAKPSPQPSAGAKSAFLKHANPSQGVTEELLRSTFSIHGEMTRCEIDKKKGLGYIDFVEPEGLRKAMAASPVKVGNGQVIVLENRSPYKKPINQAKSANPSPKPSTPSSPQLAQATIKSGPDQTKPATPPATSASSTSNNKTPTEPANSSSAAVTEETTDTVVDTVEKGAEKPSPGTPSSGKGRGGHRGRGRGGYKGQRQFRGGNRSASSPVSGTGGSNPPPTAPTEPKS